jgi:multiple sugar transport system substrate-binding protein
MSEKISRRHFLKVVSIASGAVALSACTQPTPAPTQAPKAATQAPAPTTPPQPKALTLRIAWWGGEPRHKKYHSILDLYQQKNAGVTMEREFADWAPYWEKLATQLASGNAPDLIHNHQDLVNEYANRGALLPLDPFVDGKKIDLTDWPKGTVDSGKRSGKNWMIALGGTTTSSIFNLAWIKEMGIKPPEKTWTWSDFAVFVKEIKPKLADKQYASTDQGAWGGAYETYLRQLGFELYKGEKLNQLGYPKEAVADYWQMWEDLRKLGALPPAALSQEYSGTTHADSMLAKKVVPLHLMNANQIQIYQGFIKDELSAVPMPRAVKSGSRSGDHLGTAWISIYSKTKLADDSAKFINWFINDEEPQKIFAAEHGLPGNKKIATLLLPTMNAPTRVGVELVSYLAEGMIPAPDRPTQSAQVTTAWTNAYNEMAFGRLSLKQAVDRFFDDATRILTT